MFRPMQRKKQQLSEEDCREILRRELRGVLAVQGDGGYPYAVPLNHWYCEEDGRLYFHSGASGHKIDAILREPRVSYCVLDSGTRQGESWALSFRSVVVFGRAEPVTDHAKALDISRSLSRKFTRDEQYIEDEIRHAGDRVFVFSVAIDHMSGKSVKEE